MDCEEFHSKPQGDLTGIEILDHYLMHAELSVLDMHKAYEDEKRGFENHTREHALERAVVDDDLLEAEQFVHNMMLLMAEKGIEAHREIANRYRDKIAEMRFVGESPTGKDSNG